MNSTLIIGAGVIGASIGWRLAQAGVQVTVVDQSGIGTGGASARNFGWVNASFAETDPYFALRRDAIDAMRDADAELGLDDTLQWSGCIWWEDEGDDFDVQVQSLAQRGYPARVIDADEFRTLEPSVARAPDQSILCQIEAGADGTALSQAFIAAAKSHGATVLDGCRVDKLLIKDGHVFGASTSHGNLKADQVIVATGAATDTLLQTAGLSLPMDNQSGTLVITSPIPKATHHIIMSPDVHFRQLPDGRVLMGEIFSGGGLGGASAAEFADEMLQRLKSRLPAAKDATVGQILLGTRPVPKGGLPAIGKLGNTSGLYLAVMHSGITLSALVGKLVTQDLMGQSPDHLENFSPIP